jgi:hypothetical protein
MWRPQIAQLFDELSVHATVQKIQGVRRAFNPFFELLLDRTKPVRPGRIDRSLRRGGSRPQHH